MSIIFLKLILEQIIKEVGDLNKIEPYFFADNFFITDESWRVRVYFNVYPDDDLKQLHIDNYKKGQVVNVSYNVNGKESQYQKTTYKALIKILKTVSDIVKQYIQRNPNIEALIFFAANKNEDFLLSKTDPQKDKLYKTIIIKQLGSVGMKLRDLEVDDKFKGFMITK